MVSSCYAAGETSAPALLQEADLEELLRRYGPYVARIGFGILGQREDVDDLVQDVFMALLTGYRRMRDPAAVKGWLATTAVRIARRKLRLRRAQRLIGLDDGGEHEPVDPSAGPAERALFAHLQRSLDRLPVKLRLAWCLRHIEGEELTRVAELCGCSLATVKRRIAAAEQRLKEEVGDG